MTDEIHIVYRDDALLVLEKPAGLLSVPGRGENKQDCLSARVRQSYPEASVVHRLDMATSGLMLMARGAAVQRLLNEAFAHRSIDKRYQAIVVGYPRPEADTWSTIDLPIAPDWPNRPRRIIDTRQGKPSMTRWRWLSADLAEGTSRLELAPVTGRSHQLRVHLLAIGHPILGDTLYAPADIVNRADRLQLHATVLALQHPLSRQSMHFESGAPF